MVSLGFSSRATSSLRKKHHICRFLHALMDAKCATVPTFGAQNFADNPAQRSRAVLLESTQASQPTWIGNLKALDTILSFSSPLKEQTTCLREVCKGFDESIIRQIRIKVLDQDWLPIAFDRFEWGNVFRADARRGWSSEFESREAIIDWTLLTMGCRCQSSWCTDYRTCPPWMSERRVVPDLWTHNDNGHGVGASPA